MSGMLGSQSACASENPQLTAYFSKKIGQIRSSLVQYKTSADDPSMELHSIEIDIAPSVSFGLSGVLSLTVSPEIDFVLVPEDVNFE
jgi:hypothetical protein